MLNGPYGRGRRAALRHLGCPSGEYAFPAFCQNANITPATAATVYFMPFHLPRGFVADQLAFNLQTAQAGAAVYLGLYTNDPKVGYPLDLIVAAGELNLSATTGLRSLAIGPIALPEVVWGCVRMKDAATQATMSGNTNGLGHGDMSFSSSMITAGSNPRGVAISATYAATLPAKATTFGTLARSGATNFPMFYIRRA